MAAAVEVHQLVVRYGDLVAVDRVDLHAEPGEVVAILGVNGAGKTSLVETTEGLRSPDDGTVRVLGFDPVADRDRLTPRIGVMLQDVGLPPGARPVDLVRLYTGLHDCHDEHDLLAVVGLDERRRTPVRRLSGGERQRLSLALALVAEPEVLFLDEPTAGVDVGGRAVIRALVAERRAAGTAVVLTTHELDEARRMADRLVIIDRGAVVASGTADDLMRRVGRPELRFAAPPGLDVIDLSEQLGVHVSETSPGEYVAATDPTPRVVAATTAWLADRDVPLGDLRAGRQSLDDVFLALTGGSDDVGEPAEAETPDGEEEA